MHGAEGRARIAVLKIRAPAAADEQAVARERHALVVEHERETAMGVTGRGADLERALAETDAVAVREIGIGARRPALRRERDAAAQALLQERSAGDVIGVNVGFEGAYELQPQLGDQGLIAAYLLEYGIDQNRVPALAAAQEIGIGRGLRIEELPEDQRHRFARFVGRVLY